MLNPPIFPENFVITFSFELDSFHIYQIFIIYSSVDGYLVLFLAENMKTYNMFFCYNFFFCHIAKGGLKILVSDKVLVSVSIKSGATGMPTVLNK